MKKFFTLFFPIVFGCFYLSAQIVSTESFDNTTFVPTGWALKPVLTQNAWVRVTNGTNPTASPHSGAGMARFRSSSTQVATGTQQILASRTINYSSRGTQAANLSFWMYRDNTSATYDTIQVYVSDSDTIDATATYLGTIARNRTYAMPDTQATTGWYQYTFSIPATYTNNTSTRFLWMGTSEASPNSSANMFIDDISFDEFPTNCSGTPNVGTVVNATPVVCGGSGTASLSLSAPLTGILGITYTWESAASASGPWVSFGTNAPTAVTPVLTALTYIRCSVNCSFSGLTYTTPNDSVVVSSSPLPTLGVTPSPASFCVGSSGVSITATGAANYVWSPATGLSATSGASVTATPSASTVYTILGTDSIGCSDTITVNVQVANAPNLLMTSTPNDSVCIGTTVILNCLQNNQPGLTYLWSDGKTTRRDTVIATATTTYSVVVTNGAGCSSTGSITVNALPAQNSGFTYTVNGNTYSFTDTTAGSTNWIWDFGDGNGSSNQNPTYTYSQTGNYTVTLIVTGPCKTDTISIPVAVYPLGVNQTISSSIQCYPNPTSEILHLAGVSDIRSIDVYNMHAQRVKTISADGKNLTTVSVTDLPQGVYTLRIQTAQGLYRTSFLKK